MSVHHYPTLPVGVLEWHLRWFVQITPTKIPIQRVVLRFLNQNPFPPGWTPGASPAIDFQNWLSTTFAGSFPTFAGVANNYQFLQSPTTYYAFSGVQGISAGANGKFLDPAVCPCFISRSAGGAPHVTGRYSLFPVPRNFIANGVLTTTAIGTYQSVATRMMAPLNLNGVIFQLAVFSPKHNSYTTLDNVQFNTKLTYVYRRRAGRDRIATLWTYVP